MLPLPPDRVYGLSTVIGLSVLQIEGGLVRQSTNTDLRFMISCEIDEGCRYLGSCGYQRIAYEAIRGAFRAAIAVMKNHRGHRTRPSTRPTGHGGRTAI